MKDAEKVMPSVASVKEVRDSGRARFSGKGGNTLHALLGCLWKVLRHSQNRKPWLSLKQSGLPSGVTVSQIQAWLNLRAAATIGLAQPGVCERSAGARIFRFSTWRSNLGDGRWPAAGSVSTLLSNTRKDEIWGRSAMRFSRLCS